MTGYASMLVPLSRTKKSVFSGNRRGPADKTAEIGLLFPGRIVTVAGDTSICVLALVISTKADALALRYSADPAKDADARFSPGKPSNDMLNATRPSAPVMPTRV